MIEPYRATAERIRQELAALERVTSCAIRAMARAREQPADQDFYLDSVALNLQDFYTGVERAFRRIAWTIDEEVPAGHNWHEELLRQMVQERTGIRPAVISSETADALDQYLRFRHVVRNIYTFEFDPDRIGRLVHGLSPCFRFPWGVIPFGTFELSNHRTLERSFCRAVPPNCRTLEPPNRLCPALRN